MNNRKASYDDDDEDYDFQEFIDDLENDGASFEDMMKEYGKGINELRREYKAFKSEYDDTLNRLAPKACGKLFLCRSLCGELRTNGSDKALDKMWCICVSENSDFLFDTETDEQYILQNYLMLRKDMENYMFRLENEKAYFEKAKALLENITFKEEPVWEFDFDLFFDVFSAAGEFESECLEDNLRAATEKALHSEQLTQLLPLMYYVLFTRYRNKLFDTSGYEPNFSKIFRYVEYKIDEDNGKNIAAFDDHLGFYDAFCSYFKSCDKYLCDCAFSCISNISRCSGAGWEDFKSFTRPLLCTLKDGYFSCNIENPFLKEDAVSLDDIIGFECDDEERPHKARILPKVRSFIEAHPDISEKFIALAAENRTSECMPLVMEIISGSQISTKLVKPQAAAALNACIIGEVIGYIDRCVKDELTDAVKERLV